MRVCFLFSINLLLVLCGLQKSIKYVPYSLNISFTLIFFLVASMAQYSSGIIPWDFIFGGCSEVLDCECYTNQLLKIGLIYEN